MHLHVTVAEKPDHSKPFALKKLDKETPTLNPNQTGGVERTLDDGQWHQVEVECLFLIFQINMLLTFSTGDDCPCPSDIQEELYDFHNQLQLHCGRPLLSAFLLNMYNGMAV